MEVHVLYAGGHAKQVLDAFLAQGIRVVLYDDQKTSIFYRGISVGGTVRDINLTGKHAFCTIGDNVLRSNTMKLHEGALWVNCVDPLANISPSAKLGGGNYIGPFATVGPDVTLGSGNIVNSGAIVSHDSVIGDYVHIAPGVAICGGCQIGSFVLIGVGASVIPRQHIGDHSTVGAGSVIVQTVAPSQIVVGVPAKNLKKRETE